MHRGHLPVLESRADISSLPPLWQRHCHIHANHQPSSHRGLPCLVSQQNYNCDHHRPHGPSLTNANLCPLKVLLDPVLTLHVGVGRARDVGPQPQTGWDTHRVPAPSNTLSQRETNSLACKPQVHQAERVTCLFPGKENPSWPSVPPRVRPPIPLQPLKCITTGLLLTLETCLQVQPSRKQQNWYLLVKV